MLLRGVLVAMQQAEIECFDLSPAIHQPFLHSSSCSALITTLERAIPQLEAARRPADRVDQIRLVHSADTGTPCTFLSNGTTASPE